MTSERAAEARTTATMRLREALDMERQTSQGNAMTPLRVAQFISGPWLDYIAEPYLAATPEPREDGWDELRREIERLPKFPGDVVTVHSVLAIVDRLAATPAPQENGWQELLAELANEIEVEGALYVWPENKELAAKRVAALRLAAARGEPDE